MRERGFTLIELLIVIAVLGILSGIAIFAVGNSKDDAVKASCQTNFKSIGLSAESVHTSEGAYPTTSGGSDTEAGVNTKYANLLKTASNGGLLDEYPWSDAYQLRYVKVSDSAFNVEVRTSSGSLLGTTKSACESL
jgi:prepilin-type N-terminal cleavage/methylation domain-containing protein